MKNNIDRFIKFLDNQMNIDEIDSIKNDLEKDVKLKEEFDVFSNLYSERNNNIQIDERYFSSLLPNAKKQLFLSKNKNLIRYAYALPILVLLVFLFYFPNDEESIIVEQNFENLWEVITENEDFAKNIVQSTISIENNYLSDDELISEFYSEELVLDESLFDYLENNLNLNEINDNFIDSLSEMEFKNLYDKMIDKKILGMK